MARLFPASAAAALLVGLGVTPALASGENIHIGLSANEAGAPMVVYVFSDGEVSGYAPLDAIAIALNEENGCVADFDADWNALTAGPSEAIYGPGSTRRFGEAKDRTTIDFDKLPSYFAREAVAVLLQSGVVENETQAVPYFNCAGKVWATVLSQSELPPE